MRWARRLIPASLIARKVAYCGLAVLVACATPAVERVAGDGLLFSAEGRLSVSTPASDLAPAQSHSARFSWRERADRSELALYSPLGDTVATLTVQAQRSQLRLPQLTDEADTPEVLLERQLGLRLPVSGLRDWLRGRSHTGARQAPNAFAEDGWQISYPQMSSDAPALPRIVRLTRNESFEPPTSAIDVRIVVERWQ